MSASGSGRARPAEVLLSTVATVSWAFLAMAGVAALGLHLVGADGAGALGPMTAAAVVLAVGGSVTPSGDVKAFGLTGAQAHSAVDIAPLGISLVGALLLGWLFVRSLRGAGAVIGRAELAVRAGAVVLLFLLVLAGLTWVGNDTVTIDASTLGLTGTPQQQRGGLLEKLPGELGDIADIGSGLLPDRIERLIDAKAAVGFTVEPGRSVLGGAVWVVAVLLIALLVVRRAPVPRGLEAAHRTVRPAASALCGVLVLAVGAGLAAALYAAIGDDHPRLVLGAALLGAPNGVWLGVPLGLFVPWRGRASGALVRVLPDPLDKLLGSQQPGAEEKPITVARLAELDGRVWLLMVGCVLMVLAAGVLTAVRTPVGRARRAGFVGRCALWLGIVTALALPLLCRLTAVSAGASLSVLGFDAFGAGVELHGGGAAAWGLGAGWGALAGAAGALAAWATGAAGARASRFALGSAPDDGSLPDDRSTPDGSSTPDDGPATAK
ncbi:MULTISPECIES: streptophobe family protein [unclassified Streptomyces]|uniref:streptophobe family protein n=1 Tax=unclassified Streptomyces TaxID=2593676 RepID=UPI00336A260F